MTHPRSPLLLTAVLCVGLSAPAMAASAQAGDAQAAPTPNTPPPQTVLSLQASAETTLPPDLLTIRLRAENSGADPVAVQQSVNQTVSRTLAKIKTVSSVTVITGNYNVWERNDGGAQSGHKSWQASQMLTLSSHRFDNLLDLVGRLQQDGLLLSGMEYSLSDEARHSVHDRLVVEAVAHLRSDITVAAKALNMKVAGIKTIRIEPESRPVPIARMALAATAPSGEPGDQRVLVGVEADVALTPDN